MSELPEWKRTRMMFEMERKPNDQNDLAEVQRTLGRALESTTSPREAITALHQSVLSLIKRDLVEWGLDPQSLTHDGRAVSAAVIYSHREPVFRGYLQLLALVAVLEARLAYQESEGGWKAWRRDARVVVNRLQKLIDTFPSVSRAPALA